jgi:HEAT repeat protein
MATSGCGRDKLGPVLSGGRQVKSWVADLHHPKAQVRRQAVLKLGNVGDADPAAAEGLAEALGDPELSVRKEAIFAVVKLKTPTPAIRAQLDEISRMDRDLSLRDLARRALAKLE